MRKWLFFSILVLVILVSGCGTSGNSNDDAVAKLDQYEVVHTKDEVQEGDFIYRLVSEQEEYSDGQSVALYGELEYVGKLPEITIQHAASPFYFQIEEKIREMEISYPMPEPLVSTTLKKGEPFRENYTPSGAYSEEDDKAYVEFIKDFIENGFPTGYYVVKGDADFMIPKNANEVPNLFQLKAQVDFKVH